MPAAPSIRGGAAMRIVSLVPSLTELLCELGLRDALVGRTGFCIHPRDALRDVARIGGTKDVDIDRVRALAPTHVVVNVDENRKPDVDRLAEFVPEIVVTHPVSVDDNIALIESFGERFGRHDIARRMADRQREAMHKLRTRRFVPVDVLYLIWKDPWMSVGSDTFVASMLGAAAMRSVVTAGEPRYPVVDDPALDSRGADVVLLSSEPYRFRERHRAALARSLAQHSHRDAQPPSAGVPSGEAAIGAAAGNTRGVPLAATIDGEMTSWYGARAIEGLYYLAGYREALERALDVRARDAGAP